MNGVPGTVAGLLSLVGGNPARWRLARWARLLPKIAALEPALGELDDGRLRKESLSLRYRAKSGEPLVRLLPEAYALVREAARRTIDMRHFDVQLLGGIAMAGRSIVEMQTGEGKTLTATLPLYLYALAGKGCHLATANDYLARRDAEWMRPVYEALGLSVGVIQDGMPRPVRRRAYACDVTYGTAKEFGFDFLRDRLLLRSTGGGQGDLLAGMLGQQEGRPAEEPVQREPHLAVVDEADSILIDEARTPLVIAAASSESQRADAACYGWGAEAAGQFIEDDDYEYDARKRTATLTPGGRRKVRSLHKPEAMAPVGMPHIYQHVERAIMVARQYARDRQYVVRDGQIVIVDEFTGRLGEGRKWHSGIHQAVEAKEGVEVTVAAGQAARITVQDYFLRYPHLAGMTGTAVDSARELRKIYRCVVVAVPTNRPLVRLRLPTRVFGTTEAKWAAVLEETCRMVALGRPVLIGTRSIDKSEHLSRLLTERGIEHRVLNAHKLDEEAEIVAAAGQPGRVTVSTNMAGRGTDIKLGPGVAERGGLHVIATEVHEAARIDRQLTGRCGRQGDPGTHRQHLALDDELLGTGLGPKQAQRYAAIGRRAAGPVRGLARLFRRAQRRVARRYYRQRRALVYFEKQRKKVQRQMGQDPYLDTPG